MAIPLMRASHLQANATSLAKLSAREAAAVRQRCPHVFEEIDAAVRTAWLPLELGVEFAEAVLEVCGSDRYLEWCRGGIRESADGPLLGPVLLTLRRMGVSPHRALAVVPSGWQLVYRNSGTLTHRRISPREGELVLRGADLMLENNAYPLGVAAAFDAALALACGVQAQVEVELKNRAAIFRVSWP